MGHFPAPIGDASLPDAAEGDTPQRAPLPAEPPPPAAPPPPEQPPAAPMSFASRNGASGLPAREPAWNRDDQAGEPPRYGESNGGYQESGFGREGGRHGLAAYLDA